MVRVGLCLILATLGQELPPEKSDKDVLKEAGLPVEPARVAEHLRAIPLKAEEHKQAAALVAQLGDPAFARRDAAEEQLAKLLPGAVAVLRPALRSPDPEVADRARFLIGQVERTLFAAQCRAAVRVLAEQPPAGAAEALFAFLPVVFDDATEEETLTALVRVAGKGDKLPPALVAGLDDTDPARRAAAALVVGRAGSAEQRKKVQALLGDPVLAVRFRAAQGLLAARDRAGLAVLPRVIRDGTPGQALQASDLLLALAGRATVGSLEVGVPAQRAALARSWEAWLQGPGRQADLSRADLDFGPLNRTVAAIVLARRLMAQIEAGNLQAAKSLFAYPYAHYEGSRAGRLQDLEDLIQNIGFPTAPRGEQLPTTRILPLDAVTGPAATVARAIVAQRHPREEVLAIDSSYRYPGNPTTRVTVFVRLPKGGGPPRVVGYGFANGGPAFR